MTVYVVQKQMKFDDRKGEMVPRFSSLEKASRWGKLRYLLSPSAHPFNPDLIIPDLRQKLSRFTDKDHLLLIGNPSLIGMATAIAANASGGIVNFLQWSGRESDYVEVKVRLF